MKFSTVSGKACVSFIHVPGRGSGNFDLSTGNHAEFDVACSLNLPEKITKFSLGSIKVSKELTIKCFLHVTNVVAAHSRSDQSICTRRECGIEFGFVVR